MAQTIPTPRFALRSLAPLALLLALSTQAFADPVLDLQRPAGEALGDTDDLGIVEQPHLLQYTIANLGDEPLTISANVLEDDFAGATLQDLSASTLEPGATSVFDIWLDPQAWRFSFQLNLQSNDPQQPERVLLVSGNLRLEGQYTIDNTQPTGGRNFHDFGEAFIALEEVGTGAGVEFLVYGQGGPYESNEYYGLDIPVDASSPLVQGDTLPNRSGFQAAQEMPLVFRAAPGEQPIIQGDGLHYPLFGSGPISGIMAFGVSNVTLEGLEFRSAQSFAIFTCGFIGGAFGWITIDRCRIHDIAAGPGIAMFYGDAQNGSNLVVQNCLLYNIGGNRILEEGFSEVHGMIAMRNPATGSVVRHNTIIANERLIEGGVAVNFLSSHTFVSPANIVNNIIIVQAPGRSMLNIGITTVEVGVAEGNVYWWDTDEPGPFAKAHNHVVEGPLDLIPFDLVRYETFADWQAAGHDQTGVLADPRLVDAQSDPPDPRLLPDSPAIDRGIGTPVTQDFFGNPRPQGMAPDSGAVEFAAEVGQPNIEVRHDGNAILPSSVDSLPDPTALGHGTPVHFTVHNIGSAPLEIVEVRITGTLQANVVFEGPVPLPIPASGSAFLTFIVTAKAPEWCFDVSITSNVLDRSPYTFRVLGEAVEGEARVVVRHHPEAVLPGQNGFLGTGNVVSQASSIDLGEVPVGTAITEVITVHSTRLIPVELTGTPPIQVFLSTNTTQNIVDAGFKLPPDTTVIADAAITIIPQSAGAFRLGIEIPNTSSNAPNHFFSFHGQAVEEKSKPQEQLSQSECSHSGRGTPSVALLLLLMLALAAVRQRRLWHGVAPDGTR